MLVPKLSRRGRQSPGQALVEYAIALGVLVSVFVVAAVALTSGENQYFMSLGPRLAPTPASFGTFAPTSATSPNLTPLPTATAFALATPTPVLNVNGNPTTTTVTCSPTSGTIPTSAAFQTTCTVTVDDSRNGNHTLSGWVYFSEYPTGQGSLSSASCFLSGQPPVTCTFTYTTTVAGTHTLTAFYAGTTGNNGYQSSGASATVSVTRLSSESVSCTYPGQPGVLVVGARANCQVTVTDTSFGTKVVPSGIVSWTATPSLAGGTDTFSATTCSLGAGTAGSVSCQVVFTPTDITSPSGFSFTLTATYAGETPPGVLIHAASMATTSVPVGPAATSTQTFDTSLQAGDTSVTLTAFVAVKLPSTLPASAMTGTITFTIQQGGTTYCISSAATLTAGSASTTCAVPAGLSPGSYTITATYSGDNNFATSSGTALLGVGLINTTTTATAASAPFGAPSVALSATLVVNYPAIGQVNQGTVTFTVTDVGGGVICTTQPATVVPTGGGTTSTAAATCNIQAGTPIGSYTITPSYSGGANFNPSSNPGSSVVVGTLSIIRRTTTVSVACSPSTLNAGATTLCTATVADTDIGTKSAPTGNVIWASNLGGSFGSSTCTLSGSGNSSSCQVSYTPNGGGAYGLTANYASDALHLLSSGTATLTVHRLSGTSVTCTPEPTDVGVATTCTATVTDASIVGTGGIPSGTITWSVTPSSGGGFGASGTCTLSGGKCSLGFLPATLGSLQVTASYAGDAIYLASTGSTSVTATPRVTGTSITCTPNPDNVGSAVACVVMVTDIDTGNASAPIGTVGWITNNTGSFGSAACTMIAVNGTTSTCQVSYTPGIDGPHTLTGSYIPTDNVHSGSSGTFTFNAVLGTSTAILCTPNPDAINAPTTCRVTVTGGTPSSPRPSGTVTWSTDTGSPNQFSATSCILNASGTCSVSYTPASFGTGSQHTLTANYPGDTHYLPSVTAVGTYLLPVTTRSTLTSISCIPSPVGVGLGTRCTVSVFDTSTGTPAIPTGTVTWSAGPLPPATCPLSPATGTCFVNYTAPGTPQNITVTATYPGDLLHAGSSITYALSVVRLTTTTITCTASADVVGALVSCTATVTDGGASHITPTGTVSWSVNPSGSGIFSPQTCNMVQPPSGNPASNSCTVSYTPGSIGSQTVTANYLGDSNHATSSGTFGLTVGPRLSVVASPTTITAGNTISMTVTALDQFGNTYAAYTGTIHFTSTDGQAIFPANYTFAAGDAGTHTFTGGVTLNTAGNQTVTATDMAISISTGTSNAITVSAAAASKLLVTATPTAVTAGNAVSVTVTAQDPFGNTATSYTGTAGFSSTDAQATLPGNYTFFAGDNGVHTFTNGVTLKTAGGQTVTATDTVTSSVAGTSASIAVSPAAATRLVFSQQPTNVVSTAPIGPAVTVTVLDGLGNIVTGSTASITIAIGANPGGGTLSGSVTVVASGGAATFGNLSIDKAGTGYTLAVSSAGLIGTASGAFNVTVGPAAKLAFTPQPSNTVAGSFISNPTGVQVTVQDAGGNTITTSSASVSIAIGTNPGGGTLGGTVTAVASGGVATFGNLSITSTGAYTLVASSGGLTGATSASFNIISGAASQLVVVAPPTATAGVGFSVTVTAQDVYGNTATGYAGTIDFTTTDGQSAPPANYTFLASNNGVHTFTVTLKTGGPQTVTAADTATSSITGTSANVTVTPGSASSLIVAGYPTPVAAGSPNGFTVTAMDGFGNIATGYTGTVHFASSDLQASFAPNNVTLINGTGSFSGTLRTAGNQSIIATDTVNGTIMGTQVGISVTPLATSRLLVAPPPGSVTAGTVFNLTVTAQDPYGNTTPNYLGTVHFSGSDAQGTLPGDYTFVGTDNGAHIFGGATTLKTAGTQTVTATDTVTLTIAGTSSISVSPATGVALVFVQQPANTVSSVAISPAITATVLDGFGNVATGSSASITIAISANPGSGTLSGPSTVAAVNGVATFSNLSIDKAGAGYTLAAASAGLTGATSNAFNVSVGQAAKLAFSTPPSNTVAGTFISNPTGVQVTVQDAGGNTVTTSSASITIAIGTNPASGTLVGTLTVGATGGVATFGDLSINKAGNGYSLAASSGVLTGSISNAFNVTPGASSQLGFIVQPVNTAAGAAINPAVQVAVQDSFGNTVTSSSAPITVAIVTNPGGGTLSGTATVIAASGVATFNNLPLSINKTGIGYALSATSSALTGTTSSTFNITLAAASKLVFSQQPTNAVSTSAISPAVTVTVQDAFGNTVISSAAPITIAIGTNPPGTGVLGGTVTVSAINGVATFGNLAIDKAGSGYTLTAASAGLAGATSNPFNISVGPAAKLAFSTPPSNTVAGSSISNPPGVHVTVQDAGSNTVTTSSASITMAIGANPGGGTLGGTLTASASAGIATFTLSINKTGIGYTLGASSIGLTSATSNTFNITPGPASQLVFTVQPTNTQKSKTINTAGGVQVAVEDALGNIVTTSAASIGLAIGTNPPGNGTLSGGGALPAAGGVAIFSNLSIDKTGTGYTLRATSAGLTTAISAPFNITP